MKREPIFLSIPTYELSAFYGIGWVPVAPSDTPGQVVISWTRTRDPVIPFDVIAEVMQEREGWQRNPIPQQEAAE